MDGECKQSWMLQEFDRIKKEIKTEQERLFYTAAEGSTLDLIWKGEFNKTNMSKTTTKGFDVPKGFPIPLSKSVILRKEVKAASTKTGIILNESAEENNVAVIMAAAADCNPQLTAGTKVMYNVHENRTILFEENYYLIMHELALFCILPDTAVLLPETIKASVKKTQEFRAEEKRIEAATKRDELNLLDKVKEQGKKKFNKKK